VLGTPEPSALQAPFQRATFAAERPPACEKVPPTKRLSVPPTSATASARTLVLVPDPTADQASFDQRARFDAATPPAVSN